MKKTVLVIGGSKGIGFATAKKFIENDFNVIITGRNIESLKKASMSLNNCPYIIWDVKDVSKAEEKDNLLKELDGIIVNYPKTVSAKRALFYKGYVSYFAKDYENAVVYLNQFLTQNGKDYLAPKANYFLAFSMIE
jgi:NAD(P)-dependent dehydrogenase (short-subunit alcohol dehydrogenase family)